MNGENVEKAYRMSLKRERDRERMQRKSKRYGNIRNAVHFVDFEEAETRENSPSWLSDGGKGADDIIAAVDGELGETYYERRLKWAREKLRYAHPECMDVFNLIVKNGKNRKESICQMALN